MFVVVLLCHVLLLVMKQGYRGQDKSQEKVREILNSSSKSIKIHGILFLASYLICERVSVLAKFMSFQKLFSKGIDICGSISVFVAI